jgi:2-methylcitrate dehydratase
LDDIKEIRIATHARTMETINKTGALRNPADRDHCLQYAVAVMLMNGELNSTDYEDEAAENPRIDQLRTLMSVREEPQYTARYLDPKVRANPSGIEIIFKDGTSSGVVETAYPAGHPARRKDGIPLLINKLKRNLRRRFDASRQEKLLALCLDHETLLRTPVNALTDAFAVGV